MVYLNFKSLVEAAMCAPLCSKHMYFIPPSGATTRSNVRRSRGNSIMSTVNGPARGSIFDHAKMCERDSRRRRERMSACRVRCSASKCKNSCDTLYVCMA
jgi:hypothetical protein